MADEALQGLELRSTVTAAGELHITLEEVWVGEPGPDEVVVRVEATPINPSDAGLLLGSADLATLKSSGTPQRPELTAWVPAQRLGSMKMRFESPLPVGNEGAGTVVKAGANAQALRGRKVGMLGGGMYATYRKLSATDCIALPDGASAADGASMSINPLTALSMVDTLRRENHRALVHTAAASNLGRMLNRICIADGIPLVNIVRSAEQSETLRQIGARHVIDSSAPGFDQALTDAIADAGATLAFDAIGGGKMTDTILHAMEAAALRTAAKYSRYGTSTFKQVYIYGALDTSPIEIDRSFGSAWSVGGFLLFNYLEKIGPDATEALRERVVRELTTTFASNYTQTISLTEVLQPELMRAVAAKSTGAKYLIDPTR